MHPHLAYIKNKTTKSPYVFIYKAPGKKITTRASTKSNEKKKNQSEPSTIWISRLHNNTAKQNKHTCRPPLKNS
jgi:hypothetical protein